MVAVAEDAVVRGATLPSWLKIIGRDFIVATEKWRALSWVESCQGFKELQGFANFKPKLFAMRGA
jgi:hypothetical protein